MRIGKVWRLFQSFYLNKYILEKQLNVFAHRYLLSGLQDALIGTFEFSTKEADFVIEKILPFVLIIPPRNVYWLSLDGKDNYLYNNCRILITVDKELLMDTNAPFLRKTDAGAKKKIDFNSYTTFY